MSDDDFVPLAIRRRTLLTTLASVPVITAILMLQRRHRVPERPATESPGNAKKGLGYHETEHIRKYYRSIEF